MYLRSRKIRSKIEPEPENGAKNELQGIQVFKHLDKEVIVHDKSASSAAADAAAAAAANASATIDGLKPEARQVLHRAQVLEV